MNAIEKFEERTKKNFHICVGLDSDIKKIPQHLTSSDDPIYNFNRAIIDATYKHAAAYKINLAFYEKDGTRGIELLHRTLEYLPKDILIIGDAKRGDIGNTSKMYAQALFEHFNFDASTLSPYMGYDSITPFLEYKDKLNFILALTSNPGSNDFEKLDLGTGKKLYQKVIEKVSDWNEFNNCGIVFGATNLEELKNNIKSFAQLKVLLPGVGAQGGDLESIVRIFKEENNQNFIINVSRSLIYADDSVKFTNTVQKVIMQYNSIVNDVFNS